MKGLVTVFNGCVVQGTFRRIYGYIFYFLQAVKAIERQPYFIKSRRILAQYKQADELVEKTKTLFHGKTFWRL